MAQKPPEPTPTAAPACQGPITAGPPSIQVEAGGARFVVPMSDCALGIPAGKTRLSVLISNLQQPKPIKVTGAPEGRWEGQWYHVDLDLAQGQAKQVSLDLSGLGGYGQVTYTLTGEEPVAAVFASGPSRTGPWAPIQGSFLPADHSWIRIHYPLPMEPGMVSPISPERYSAPNTRLAGQWEGDRVQYVQIGQVAPVLFVSQATSGTGLQFGWINAGMLFRGAPPEMQRVAPATGKVTPGYRFGEVPRWLSYKNGKLLSAVGDRYQEVDLATGRASEASPPEPVGAGEHLRFLSPDGKLVAELLFPEGAPGHASEVRKRLADLIIKEQATGKTVLHLKGFLSSWGGYSCTRGTPDLAWRADSQAVAVQDAPDENRVLLKVVELKGAVRTVTERTGRGIGYSPVDDNIAWSPSGKLIAAGVQLVDAESGQVVAEPLPKYSYWSGDSKFLLLYGQDHPFTNWGKVQLLDVATGKRQELGHGQALGWTAQGEALLVRFDLGRQIPPPAKGCP